MLACAVHPLEVPLAEPTVRPYPELSFVGVSLGLVQGVVMTAAFVYIALKLGFGLGGSTVAAIIGFTMLRGVLRRKSIVENNINQTVASGINTASAGVVFTLPALLMMSATDDSLRNFPMGALIFAAVAGSFMGIVLIIPLRKQMIEFERLKFPSGVAVATLLKSPGEGLTQGMLLLIGAGLAALLTVVVNAGLFPGEIDLGAALSIVPGIPTVPPWLPIALYVSAANIGAGLLSGKGGLPFAAGGVLAWWIIAPMAVAMGWVEPHNMVPAATVDGWQAAEIYSQMLRPLGIGMLIGGALAGVVSALPAVVGAMKSLTAAAKVAREQGSSPEEINPVFVYGGMVGAFVLLMVASLLAPGVSVMQAVLIAIVGAIWMGLAGIIVATATGHTDISPLSGLSLIAVTLMFFLTGGNVTAAIVIGVAVCIAINQCADMMSDLKTGHLIGARPIDQQIAQLMLGWVGPLVAIGVLFLLWHLPSDGSPGFGPASTACIDGTAQCLSAPQGDALQSILDALRNADSSVDKYVSGAFMGGALSIFPIGGIAVLIGLAMYLPFSITLAYGLGCLISLGLEKRFGTKFIGRMLVPFAAGLIVGEAVIQLGWSFYEVLKGGA
ncbi:MAG: putative OPT family oligopeptide transporter [Kiritimatiellia bacterium]|jgi:putative OPT family oligopeptide transporter